MQLKPTDENARRMYAKLAQRSYSGMMGGKLVNTNRYFFDRRRILHELVYLRREHGKPSRYFQCALAGLRDGYYSQ